MDTGTEIDKKLADALGIDCYSFSTSMIRAWEIVTRLTPKLLFAMRLYDGKWEAAFFDEYNYDWDVKGGSGDWIAADTPALAICRAALRALKSGKEVKP